MAELIGLRMPLRLTTGIAQAIIPTNTAETTAYSGSTAERVKPMSEPTIDQIAVMLLNAFSQC
jgi:hypothetical protein